MRVITGAARGRRLIAPEGLSTRPTSELVKEAVFSMIQFEIEGAAVLDLFAGSGQMGIEALSRGARSCMFVDHSKACQNAIAENLKNTGLADKARVLPMDAAIFAQSGQGPFDLAFIDPPYGQGFYEKSLQKIAGMMSETGVLLCESDRAGEMPGFAGALVKYKEYRYGKTKITVYRPENK